MTVDTSLIGQMAADMMELLPDEAEGNIVAVGMVVIVENDEGTYTRIKCSSDLHYEQLGIFLAALEIAQHTPSDDE